MRRIRQPNGFDGIDSYFLCGVSFSQGEPRFEAYGAFESPLIIYEFVLEPQRANS